MAKSIWRSFTQLRQKRFPHRIGKWSKFETIDAIRFEQCEELSSIVRAAVSLPHGTELFDLEKVTRIRRRNFFRRTAYHVSQGTFWFSLIMFVLVFCIGISAILQGTSAEADLNNNMFYAYLLLFGLSAILASGIKNGAARLEPLYSLEEVMNPSLFISERGGLLSLFYSMKSARTKIYEREGGSENLSPISQMFWTVDYWYLIFSEYDLDRRAIWLDGQPPKGPLYCMRETDEKTAKRHRDRNENPPWGEIKHNDWRLIVSRVSNLKDFIEFQKEKKLSTSRKVWLKAFKYILDHHEQYKRYLANELHGQSRDVFYVGLAEILAENAKSPVSPERKKSEVGDLGAYKFLRGLNENIQNWIDESEQILGKIRNS